MSQASVAPALPSGTRLPAALASLLWFRDPIGVMRRGQARHGDMFTWRIANEGTWIFVSDPATVQQVFTLDPGRAHAGEANVILEPVLGRRSILLLDGAAHMEQRKLLLGPLHHGRVQTYSGLMEGVATDEVSRWPRGRPLQLWPRMQAITLEIIVRAVFGAESSQSVAAAKSTLSRMLAWTTSPRRLAPAVLLGPRRLRRLRSFRDAIEPVDRMLSESIKTRRADPHLDRREDILSMLVDARHENGSPMTDEEIRDELMTLLVAGHETTASALAWALERLVRHPEMLARLRDELDANREEYLDAIVKETLRLRPPIAVVLRRLTEPAEIGGHLLPAGVSVAPCVHLVHRRPEIYPEPERFLPERFLEKPPGTYTWIPFGGGVRRCVGAGFAQFEMRSVLRAILRAVDLRPVDAADEAVGRRAITLVPARGTRVIVEDTPRNRRKPPFRAGIGQQSRRRSS